MEEVLARALGNLNGSIEENKAVVTHDPLPAIMGDQTHVERLFQNLIGNALKYRRQEAPRIHIAARDLGKECLFAVSDNGQGIPPQHQTQIFELFKRLHGQQYPGSGIGLATCKRLVERYGGRIWVESEAGRGSTFFFTLPASGETSLSASAKA
jgi:light-regulated signal transduction histidine kinase (bacteriophytochrome)